MVKWLSGDLTTPVKILETEMRVEPSRAESVIFMQPPDQISHFEFQPDVKDSDPLVEFRMLNNPVLLPFVPLTKTQNPKELLKRVAGEIKKIDNIHDRGTISACT